MASFDIRGSIVVLTGAGSGIGAALARTLAAGGAQLALADRNGAGLSAVAAACRANGVCVTEHVFDVTDPAALDAFPAAVIAEHGAADVLVNNAGIALLGNFEQITIDDFEWVIAVNFRAPVRLSHAFLPHLRTRPRAHIVNLSSIFGVIAPPGQTAYCASKFGLRGFSESLRHELIGSTITLTVVHPGGINTAIATSARIGEAVPQAERDAAARDFGKFLTLSPEAAAADIVRAIETRAPRLLIGRDARGAERLQRLFPTTYWSRIARRMMKPQGA